VRVREICLLGAVLAAGLVSCSDKTNPRVVTRLNEEAALAGELPSNPLRGKVITSWVNKKDATMSTMFGNDVAEQYARTKAAMQYPAGAVLSVVTWSQQEDPRWFGGSIPQKPRAVEFVTVTGPGAYSYERYEGSPLKNEATGEGADSKHRAAYLLAQRAAVMP
jgi:hypothetical protein